MHMYMYRLKNSQVVLHFSKKKRALPNSFTIYCFQRHMGFENDGWEDMANAVIFAFKHFTEWDLLICILNKPYVSMMFFVCYVNMAFPSKTTIPK